MARVLICSDSPFINTGFSTVARSIASAAHKAGHEVFHLGFSDPRDNQMINKWAGRTIPWTVIPTQKTIQDQFGQHTFPNTVMRISPNVVIVVADVWNVDHLLLAAPCPTVLLLHIEGSPLPTKVVNMIGGVRREIVVPKVLLHSNNVVTAGPFARKVIQDRLVQFARYSKKSEVEVQAIIKNTNTIIPDAVDTSLFKPIDRVGLKEKMFKIPSDSFVVGFFGRQNPRKGLPYAVQAFAKWKDRPKNSYLYLHTAMKDAFGWNIMQMLSDYGVTDNVIIDPSIKVGGGCSEEVLNMFYNACFPAGTPVHCEGGYRPIDEIRTGDVVLSANGKLRKVTAVSVRDYSGNMIKITTNRTVAGVMCTPEHPFLMLDGSFVEAKNLHLGDVVLSPYTETGVVSGCGTQLSECDAYNVQDKMIAEKRNSQILPPDRLGGWSVIEKPGQVPYIIKNGVTYIGAVVESILEVPSIPQKVYNLEVEEDHSYVVCGIGVHNCDVTILPSTGEGAGLTILESAAAGTPAITTHYAEAPNYMGQACEYVDPSAFWVDPGTNIERAIPDVDQIVRKFRKFQSDPAYTVELGARACKHIRDNFSTEKVSEKWLSLIDAAVKIKNKATSVDKVPVSSKPKICFVGSYFLPDLLGGGEITYHKILKEFEARGWKSYCFISREGLNEESLEVDGIWTTRVPALLAPSRAKAYMKKLKPDVVITTLIDPVFTRDVLQAAKDEGAVTVYYEQFYNCITRRYKDTLLSTEKEIVPWGRQILSSCDLIYSNGSFVQNVMKKLVGFQSKVLHPFIDFSDCAVPKGKHDPKYVTMVNPDPGKGGDTLVHLVQSMPDVEFLAVKVSNKCDYRAVDAAAKACKNLTIWEFQKDVRKVYEKTKLLIIPTIVDETFGRVIQEAQSNGIPVIGRDVGGIKDTMGDGGILIGKFEDDDVWVEEVRKVLGDKELYNDLSKKGLENVKKIDFKAEMDSIFKDVTEAVGKRTVTTSSSKAKVLCLSPRNFHGVEEAFNNLKAVYPGKVAIMQVDEFTGAAEVLSRIGEVSPETVTLGAWIQNYRSIIGAITDKFPKIKITVSWFSNFSQMEFTRNELPALATVRGMIKEGFIDELWMSSEEDAAALAVTDKSVKFFPCPFDPSVVSGITYTNVPGITRVSLFCTPGPRKNLSNQLVACAAVPGIELHLNGLSTRPEFSDLLSGTGIRYVEHGWMSKDEYRRAISSMDVGLQVTYAETFNYVALEHMLHGTPVVASRMVPVVAWDKSLESLIVDRVDSSSEIAEKVIKAAASRGELSSIVKESATKILTRNNKMVGELMGL